MERTTKQKIYLILFAFENILDHRDEAAGKIKETERRSPEYSQQVVEEMLKQEAARRYRDILQVWEEDMTRDQIDFFKRLEERI